ncbi:BirA family biotin operon repressor/biotin-[acetyl-CoA-carboxylase] ligase [Hypnocyclicus thermotrophus]|uniref:biotin--[biotin carboxyl-carrier protein] ligase n=1 Tax=Hypnocyclicus thermotrophus TaxID=1627895 RepID=A0AA46I568_9FUSO|nr:biotin--[acetyl-CoA-carboxylase] ligase [Hypnocyclicus thermotrophus]TDT68544.1 BirA family biotin operon repressor/biotin-[acetyl-CoA-carboxylase] ligase [Hypnocyclicus thermotrophus]
MNIIKFDSLDSTNNYLKNLKTVVGDEVIIAKTQTNGRGRRGNEWASYEGAALFSFVLLKDYNLSIEKYTKLPFIVGISVLKVLKSIVNLEFKFKWTNDIYLNNKKISGILVENINNRFIIGIGININNTNFGKFKDIATSLKLETEREFDIESIIKKVIEQFEKEFSNYKNNGWKEQLEYINNYNYLFNKEIIVKNINNSYQARAKEIDITGKLIIEKDNNIEKIDIGEISIKKLDEE